MNLWVVFVLNLFYFSKTQSAGLNNDEDPVDQTQACVGQFKCADGQCINKFNLCDGVGDCKDKSDETKGLCERLIGRCPFPFYQCAYGACVKNFTLCNETLECSPYTTFENCLTCGNSRFACESGMCIPSASVCDGKVDCDDGSEERIGVCLSTNCTRQQFRCTYGACIELANKCDGIKDCADGSDEDEEKCSPQFSVYSVQGYDRPYDERPPSTTRKPFTPTGPSKPQAVRGCLLPEEPVGGSYKILDCRSCNAEPGQIVPFDTKIKYNCTQLYQISEKYQYLICLRDTLDWSSEPPRCLKKCRSLESKSMNLECRYKGQIIPCNSTIVEGTTLTPTCKNAYHVDDPSKTFLTTVCREDGYWEREPFKCSVYCGERQYQSGQATIAGGVTSKQGEFPWHAGLYFKNNQSQFEKPACGGSIIHPSMILTAAHCVYYKKNWQLRPADTIRIGVGKHFGAYNHPEKHSDFRDVKQIVPHKGYNGNVDREIFDIAVIELAAPLDFSNAIRPVCIDWQLAHPPKLGDVGTVMGWGATLDSMSSNELQTADLTFMDLEKCRETASKQFRPYLTVDKYCTTFANGIAGSGVAKGDSGGGMVFKNKDGFYYIYGIVSLKATTQLDQDEKIAALTSLEYHFTWLAQAILALEEGQRLEKQKKGISNIT